MAEAFVVRQARCLRRRGTDRDRWPIRRDHELVASYWILEVKDMDEAVAWVKRCPNPMFGASELEIRPAYEMSDFDAIVAPEPDAVHERVRQKLENR